jgi:hypothetical protein
VIYNLLSPYGFKRIWTDPFVCFTRDLAERIHTIQVHCGGGLGVLPSCRVYWEPLAKLFIPFRSDLDIG